MVCEVFYRNCLLETPDCKTFWKCSNGKIHVNKKPFISSLYFIVFIIFHFLCRCAFRQLATYLKVLILVKGGGFLYVLPHEDTTLAEHRRCSCFPMIHPCNTLIAPSSEADKQKSPKNVKRYIRCWSLFLAGEGVEDIWAQVPNVTYFKRGRREITYTLGSMHLRVKRVLR